LDLLSLLPLYLNENLAFIVAALLRGSDALPYPYAQVSQPPCRFSKDYTQAGILANPDSFISSVLYWEGKFHQNNVSLNTFNGMSYDGTLIDPTTGLATAKHPFSAASKEERHLRIRKLPMILTFTQSLQVMLYTHALAGSQHAARFLSPNNPNQAPNIAFHLMSLKLQTYLQFNKTYPGFGGFLPWYTGDTVEISPTYDWVNRVPALDNG
jgi:hypothetical protein